MTRLAPAFLALALAATPALAQDDAPAPNPDLSAGAQQLSEGFRLLLRGLMAEGSEGWDKMVDWLGDLSAYEPPEQLPNGDIIIRRKPDAPPVDPAATDL